MMGGMAGLLLVEPAIGAWVVMLTAELISYAYKAQC
jgi:hypothetical protein